MVLIKGGYISDREIASLYSEDLCLDLIPSNLEAGEFDKELAGVLPEKLCYDRLICPMKVRDGVLDVAFVSPEELGVIDELRLLTGLRINPLIAPLSFVQAQIGPFITSVQQAKGDWRGRPGSLKSSRVRTQDDYENILDLDDAPPPDANGRMVRMVNQVLEQAMRNGASDIHLEPFEDACKFRLRIDGVLHELSTAIEGLCS